jgi:hypothetical protein
MQGCQVSGVKAESLEGRHKLGGATAAAAAVAACCGGCGCLVSCLMNDLQAAQHH